MHDLGGSQEEGMRNLKLHYLIQLIFYLSRYIMK